MTPADARERRPEVDGPHAPDGWTGEHCAYCSRAAKARCTTPAGTTVLWPCPAVLRLRAAVEESAARSW